MKQFKYKAITTCLRKLFQSGVIIVKTRVPKPNQQIPGHSVDNFKEAKTMHNIVHRIHTADNAEPCYAKVRPLPAGSPKAEGGKKA